MRKFFIILITLLLLGLAGIYTFITRYVDPMALLKTHLPAPWILDNQEINPALSVRFIPNLAIRLSNLTLKNQTAPEAKFTIGDFRLGLQWMPLLSGKIVIDTVTLADTQIVLTKALKTTKTSVNTAPGSNPTAASSGQRFTVEVQHVNLKNITIEYPLQNGQKAGLYNLEGKYLPGIDRHPFDCKADFKMNDQSGTFQALGAFESQKQIINFESLKGDFLGGKLQATGTLALGDTPTPKLQGTWLGFEVSKMVALGGSKLPASGQGSFSFNVVGTEAKGQLTITQGKFSEFPIRYILETADALLKKQPPPSLSNDNELVFSKLATHLQYRGDTLTLSAIQIEAAPFFADGQAQITTHPPYPIMGDFKAYKAHADGSAGTPVSIGLSGTAEHPKWTPKLAAIVEDKIKEKVKEKIGDQLQKGLGKGLEKLF